MPNAATVGDMVKQDTPHCHAPIHPPAPVPAPAPHPGLPLTIIQGNPKVLIGGKPAATMTSTTTPCMLPGCVPGGPGMVAQGSTKVLIGGLPAAYVGAMTAHTSCVAPIPAPVGSIKGPGNPKVQVPS